MRPVFRFAVLTLVAAGLILAAASPQAFAEKIPITKLSDLPPHSYKLAKKPSELAPDRAAVLELAAAVEKDIKADLEKYDVQDVTAQRRLYGSLLTIAMLKQDTPAARELVKTVRGLQEKPAQKLTSGLLAEALLAARESGGDVHAALRDLLGKSLAVLPYSEVQDVLKQSKASFEIMSQAIVLGGLQAAADPAAASGSVSQDIASGIVQSGYVLNDILPYREDVLAAYTAVLDANKEERKAEIWEARSVALSAAAKTAPVVVGIWDSGTDVALFPNQVWTNAKEIAGNGKDDDKNGFVDDVHGIAWSLHSDPERDLLYPIGTAVSSPENFKTDMKGFSDLQVNLDTSESAALKKKLSGLKAEEVKPYVEGLTAYSFYAHGTHVAGIAALGNPAAKLLVSRITFDYHAVPETPTIEQAKKDAAGMVKTVEYFKQNGVRVVNMSWGGGLRDVEVALEKNNAGGTPEERRALARKIYDIGYDALFSALKNAPNTLFVVAAGNEDNDVKFDEVMPSSFKLPNVLVAGAVDQAGEQTSFTSFGNVDVYSNGYEVESYVPGGDKLKLSGTSMSAPNVTNLAAKIWALHPELSVAQVREFIVNGAEEKRSGEKTIRLMNPKASVDLSGGGVQ